MSDENLEPWMTNAAGPYIRIKAGAGEITITAIVGHHGTLERTIDTFDDARSLAHAWTDQLAEGHDPQT